MIEHDHLCLCPQCTPMCQDDYEYASKTGQYVPKPSAMIAPCDDCGNETAVLNCNSVSNPYMLCGRCQYAQLGDIDAGQEWNSPHAPFLGLTMFNSRLWILGRSDGLTTVDLQELPELIIALQVAQARQEAAQKGAK